MKSMTGFGRAVVKRGSHTCTVEIRTVNHRFLEISLKLPRPLQQVESAVRRQLGGRLRRGSVSVTVTLDGQEEDLGVPAVNRTVASRYVIALRDFQRRNRLGGEIDINMIAALPDFFTWEQSVASPKRVLPLVRDAVGRAIDLVERERRREGGALAKECRRRVARVRSLLKRVERRAPQRAREMKERYLKRIRNLVGDTELDQHRLTQEIATLADRLDFTEETLRLETHAGQFVDLMNGTVDSESLGRRLNFLLQEMGREANTIGSKASDPRISMVVIEIKEEIEKLREQVQNVE